eukprot:243584-Chlamydomonas_euryale.AAC.1
MHQGKQGKDGERQTLEMTRTTLRCNHRGTRAASNGKNPRAAIGELANAAAAAGAPLCARATARATSARTNASLMYVSPGAISGSSGP